MIPAHTPLFPLSLSHFNSFTNNTKIDTSAWSWMALLPFSSSTQVTSHTKYYSKKHRYYVTSMSKKEVALNNTRKEDIVIVGAGIAGLATALSLHRLGVGSLVLEQSESLRTGGTSLTLFKNGWRVLDAIGVADELRTKFSQIQGLVVKSYDGRELRSFTFDKEAPGQEVRAVERRVLLESLASPLPSDRILYKSKLISIEKQGDRNETMLQLQDGSQIVAKIVIACDGARSPIAKWLGFSEPKYAGYSALRGLAIYPQGHSFKPNINNVYGRGTRAGYLPISSTKVYWFICYNTPVTDKNPNASLKHEASDLIKSWQVPELQDIIKNTEEEVIVQTPLGDRWLWPVMSPRASKGNVVVVGDAWHPMTPNLGQGACCALEDSVVLAGKLAAALGDGQEAVDEALREYGRERWKRIFPLTVRSSLVGKLLQIDDPFVCGVRDGVVVPKLVRLGPLLDHTNFECDLMLLQPQPIKS